MESEASSQHIIVEELQGSIASKWFSSSCLLQSNVETGLQRRCQASLCLLRESRAMKQDHECLELVCFCKYKAWK